MRFFAAFISILFLSACSNTSVKQTPHKIDSNCALLPNPALEKLDSLVDVGHDEMQEVWVIVGDTSQNYNVLDAEMYLWAAQLNWGIDTMERYYDINKNALVVSEKSEDEMYRGEYFPRRFGTETLSIEYLSTYSQYTRAKTFALVFGIYESEAEAKKALNKSIKVSQHAFILPCNLYMGCMH
jgi:hypothetical protein